MIKNRRMSAFEDYFVIKKVETKYPKPSESKSAVQRKDFVLRTYC